MANLRSSPVTPQGSPTRSRNMSTPSAEQADNDTADLRAALLNTARKHRHSDESIQEMHTLVRRREHWFCERIHALEDQLQDRQNRIREERAQFEKQIKTSEKNHWKAELSNVKLLQDKQDLKQENAALTVRLEQEVASKEAASQESFERAYAVAGLTEELDDLKKELKTAQQGMEVLRAEMARKDAEMEALKERARLAEEERALWQAQFEAQCNRPTSEASVQTEAVVDAPNPVTSPETTEVAIQTDLAIRTYPVAEIAVQTEPRDASNVDPKPDHSINIESQRGNANVETELIMADSEENKALQEEVQALQQELAFARTELEREQEGIKMLHLECQFQRCPCRRAEREGRRYVYDVEYDMKEREKNKRKAEDDLAYPDYISLKQRKTAFLARRQELASKETEYIDTAVTTAPTSLHTADQETTAKIASDDHSEATSTSPLDRQFKTSATGVQSPKNAEIPAATEAAATAKESTNPLETPRLDHVDESSLHINDVSSISSNQQHNIEGSPTITAKMHAGLIPSEEAALIPLPPSRDDDPEPTALLEDMTQVIINAEPVSTTKNFTFSTSTAERPRFDATPAASRTHQPSSSATDFASEDLFDLAPPTQSVARPKHALINQTNISQSPIRMVPPESPTNHTIHTDTLNSTPSASPPLQSFRTVQIPLKDAGSPLRNIVNSATPSYAPLTPKPRQKPTFHSMQYDMEQTPKRAVSTHESQGLTVPLNDENRPPTVLAPGTPQWRRNATAQIEARRRRIERDASNRSMP